jgi:hypothetical protein
MDNKPYENPFREVHRKVQDVRDKARTTRDEAARRSHKAAEEEARKDGFDRPAAIPQSEDESFET